MNYANDHDSFIPPLNTASPSLDWDPPKNWWQLLQPYTRDDGVYRCPAKKRTKIGYSMNHRCFAPPRSSLSHLNLWVAPQQITVVKNAAGSVVYEKAAERAIERFTRFGYDKLPLCMAKTHLSLSHDAKLKGAPTGYEFPVRDVRASVGAGFLYPRCGAMRTMPGLPTTPAGENVDIGPDGRVVGLF